MPVATNGADADAALNTFAQALRKAEGSGEELEKQIQRMRGFDSPRQTLSDHGQGARGKRSQLRRKQAGAGNMRILAV